MALRLKFNKLIENGIDVSEYDFNPDAYMYIERYIKVSMPIESFHECDGNEKKRKKNDIESSPST